MSIYQATYYECGICGHFHPATWDGDCRDDANRFTAETLDNIHGPDGWDTIDMSAIDEWRRMQPQLPTT